MLSQVTIFLLVVRHSFSIDDNVYYRFLQQKSAKNEVLLQEVLLDSHSHNVAEEMTLSRTVREAEYLYENFQTDEAYRLSRLVTLYSFRITEAPFGLTFISY